MCNLEDERKPQKKDVMKYLGHDEDFGYTVLDTDSWTSIVTHVIRLGCSKQRAKATTTAGKWAACSSSLHLIYGEQKLAGNHY
jgi:hypothetical protein